MSTLTTIAATDIISASRSVINANFATLNSEKVDIAGTYADPLWLTSISGAKVTGGISGNAATATRLATARTIAGVAFDGTANISIPYSGLTGAPALAAIATSGSASDLSTGTVPAARGGAGAVSGLLKADGAGLVSAAVAGTDFVAPAGNAATATRLATARTIAGVAFDGTANINIASTGLSDSSALVRNNQANSYTSGSKQTFASNATTAGAAFGGGITADPSSVSAGDFWYRTDLGTFGFRNASAVDALVAGGRALSTVGSVPFVTASGVLGQSANLFWDIANGRLGVGTNAPLRPVHIRAAGGFRVDVAGSGFDFANTNTGEWSVLAVNTLFRFGVLSNLWVHSSTGNTTLGTTTDDGVNRLQVAGSARFATTANGTPVFVSLSATGTGSDAAVDTVGSGAYINLRSTLAGPYAGTQINKSTNTVLWFTGTQGLDSYGWFTGSSFMRLASLTTGGTLALYNETPTIGSTSLVVRAGAGQGSDLLQVFASNGTTSLFRVDRFGVAVAGDSFVAGAGSKMLTTGFAAANNAFYGFSSTSSSGGAIDTALSRRSAGLLSIDSGTAIGTTPANARDIMLRRTFAAETTTDPSAADLTIAGSNAQDVAAIYVKNDKLVVAYNRSGTVNYLTIPLDGATTTFTQSTTAP